MGQVERVDAYAAALFEVAQAEGSLEQIEEELFTVARTVDQSDELRSTLSDPAVPIERRLGIVHDVFEAAHPTTVALVSFVVAAGRARELREIIDRLVERAAERRSEIVAEVRSAVELGDEHRKRLAEALSQATGLQVAVKVVIDPEVLGGVVAQVGDQVYDGTVRTRLQQLREAL